MTLTAVYPERATRNLRRWATIWRTDGGNFCHRILPLNVRDDTKEEATAYALANPPVWK